MIGQHAFKTTCRAAGRQFQEFWLRPASPRPLAALRIGVAGVLLFQAVALFGSVPALFGPEAVISWNALNSVDTFPLSVRGPFHLRTVAEWLRPLGIGPEACVEGTFMVYVIGLVGLLVGYRSRTCAVLAFATHVLLTNSAPTTTYGVDTFARIALFYCIWMPVGAGLSIDAHRRPGSRAASSTARVSQRVLQLHLAVMYLATGLHKAAGEQWWNGEAIWRAVTLPHLAQFDLTWLANVPWLPVLVGWGTLAVEIGYCVAVWHPRTRRFAVAAVIGMHVGIALLLGLTSFASIMIALNVAAFVVSDKPQRYEPRTKSAERHVP